MKRKSIYNIVIVDDHELFRDGLKFFLTQVSGMKIVGEAANGADFLKLLKKVKPDMVLMDIAMPVMDGIEATRQAIKYFPELKIVALTGFGDEEYYTKMIQAGAVGFILKHAGKEDIETAIHAVMGGSSFISNEILQNLILSKSKNGMTLKADNQANFSEIEKELLKMTCKGKNDDEISDSLKLDLKTMNEHRNKLLIKTGSKNAAGLIIYAFKNQLVEI